MVAKEIKVNVKKNIIGKNDIEADGFLFNLLRDPQIPESGPPITKLDSDVLKEAYALKPGPIPGVSYIYICVCVCVHSN